MHLHLIISSSCTFLLEGAKKNRWRKKTQRTNEKSAAMKTTCCYSCLYSASACTQTIKTKCVKDMLDV